MQKNIFTELRSEHEHLSRVERALASIILDHPQEFIHYSVAELAGLPMSRRAAFTTSPRNILRVDSPL